MIRIILSGIILIFLQIFKSGNFAWNGITLNFLISYAVFLGWVIEEKKSFFLIFLTGLGYDLMQPQTLGLNAISLVLICWITVKFHQSVLEPKIPVMLILTSLVSFFYYIVFGIYYLFLKPEFLEFFRILIFSTLYNSLINLIIFYLLRIVYRLEIRYR